MKNLKLLKEKIQIPNQMRKDDHLPSYSNTTHLYRRLPLVMDRTFLAGFTGTCANWTWTSPCDCRYHRWSSE